MEGLVGEWKGGWVGWWVSGFVGWWVGELVGCSVLFVCWCVFVCLLVRLLHLLLCFVCLI